ncbi:MAG TPA: VOC family protein [Ilumatobacter sp.]|nr:VOC family protein [Ilumatobacter sp.]
MNQPIDDTFAVMHTIGDAEHSAPRREFVNALRAQLHEALGLENDRDHEYDLIQLPDRISTMTSTAIKTGTNTGTNTGSDTAAATAVIPYLTASNATDALDWYVAAFGAVERMRVVGDDGRLGHAEFAIGAAAFYLSDEYPEIGVRSPSTLGGSSATMHLNVSGVDDLFTRLVAAGATAVSEPADQPHGARHGTLVDPYGHRWMLSQQVAEVDTDEYAARSQGTGFTVIGAVGDAAPPPRGGGIWASIVSPDAAGLIRFYVDVLGFVTDIVVPDDSSDPGSAAIAHSQLRWPEGGVLQISSTGRGDNVYSQRPAGSAALYVITAQPHSVWARCQAADVAVVDAPQTPDYAPDTMVFSVADPDGNIVSFGSYAGEHQS